MSGAVSVRTPGLRLAILNFAFPNWGDDANKNMRILDAAFSAFGIAITGAWENSTEYPAGSVVVDTVSNELYRANVAHISSIDGTFADERANNPLMWGEYSTEATSVGDWQPDTTYFQNNVVRNGYIWAIANKRYTSSNSFQQDIDDNNLIVIVDLEGVVNETEAYKNASETAANLAAADRVQTGEDRIAASNSASQALTYRNTASTHATTASNKAIEADTSANHAAASATASGNSASASATSAGQSATSASSSATSATNSSNSATASEASRVQSANAATTATDAADTALDHRNAAAGSATTATTQAGIAVQAANDALDRKGEVELIAWNVENNAIAAASSELHAAQSASQALGFRDDASTHASNAADSATAAGNAATAADDAADRAEDAAESVGNPLQRSGGTMTGGLSFGAEAVTDPNDLSRHIELFESTTPGTGYGFSVSSGRLNYRANGAHHWISGSAEVMSINQERLRLEANVPIEFVGTGAATTRANLGLGSAAIINSTVSTADPSGGENNDAWDVIE